MTMDFTRILGATAAGMMLAGAGIAATAFNMAISRKPPLSNEVTEESDLVAATMAGARRDGRDWLRSTAHQRWEIIGHRGVRLAGYYVPAQATTHKTVVLLHGHRADATLMGPFARDYRARGFNVFLADHRAHGKSGGRYVGLSWLDHLDHLRWLDRLITEVGPSADIVLHGLSMGGATALMLGGSPDLPGQVRAVVSDCAFSSAYDELAHQLRTRHLPARAVMPLVDLFTRALAGYRLTQASPHDAVTRTPIPVLLIHGGADAYNPTPMAHELHEANPRTSLWIVPGADHGMSYFTDPDAYRERVRQFLAPLTHEEPAPAV
ncbi:alpha/beta hydrolase [Streptomyces sp. NPDC047022]|uniref:alpha/beta hydrolase n=1 Tax=Streptomyces sp. NPDC047022 TaxID=3155737 RepID=UPI003402A3AB